MFARKQGDAVYQRIHAALEPSTRQLIEEGLLETTWYPYANLVDLSVTIDRIVGQGDLALCETMGSFSCEHNLTGIYRIFFRFGNLDFLLDRAAKAWRSQYDFGTMTLHRIEKGKIQLELSDTPPIHRALYLAVKGWSYKAAQLCGSELIGFEDGYSSVEGESSSWTFDYL